MEASGKTLEVLNRYQRLIMEHESAYNEQGKRATITSDRSRVVKPGEPDPIEKNPDLRWTYRHGDGSAEILDARVVTSSSQPVDLIDSGTQLTVVVRAKFNGDIDRPVVGFLLRNRHGVHAYGANTEQKGLSWNQASAGEIVEVSFSFECWLGGDLYSLSVAVHSEAGKSYDWLDGVHFFRVASVSQLEGIANLNASASLRSVGKVEPTRELGRAALAVDSD
jgi:hypothetical protein